MAVLNPPRFLPSLGRSILNFVIESNRTWDEDGLIRVFKPPGLNEDVTAADGIKNTLSALRAIGMLSGGRSTQISATESILALLDGVPMTRTKFRRVLQVHVLDPNRDGDPWQTRDGDAHTGGARDLCRALSWFLAQDALGRPLTWTTGDSMVQTLQAEQFASPENETWAVTNDTRWGAFTRLAPALGFASPSLVRTIPGLVPLPTVAIGDVLDEFPAGRMPIAEFLSQLARKLPVLHGSQSRESLVTLLGRDPDPGVATDGADSSIGQALRTLAEEKRLTFETLADAEGLRLSRYDEARTTHVTLTRGDER